MTMGAGCLLGLLLFTVILTGTLDLTEGAVKSGSVYCKNRKCSYVDNKLDKKGATVYGTYNDQLLTNGWGILDIVAGYGAKASNDDIMFGAGLLEGVQTAEQIYEHYLNIGDAFFSSKTKKIVDKVKKFFADQNTWLRKMIKMNTPQNPFWRHVSYVMAQFDGLVEGYHVTASPNKTLDVFAFQVLNGAGDLFDLMHALAPETIPDWSEMSKSELMTYMARNGRCSALIKVTGAYEDIFMSHSSWFIYAATMRIFKHWNFNVNDKNTAAKQISLASYPGFLESLDDFYLLGSQIVMLQTTNSVFNKTLYSFVKPMSILAWQRVRVANMMAHSGKEWASTVAQFNSGTYNNQYMIVDLKKIHLGQTIDDDALWVVEQIPTLVKSGDQTPVLRTGYWPSYNVPFYEEIYNLSGYPEIVSKVGADASYQLAPRAKIFRRDQGSVIDMKTMKQIMRYNDYKNDPYSEKQPCDTICCRGDLMSSPGPFGCYDTKVSDFSGAQKFTADIINGPTLGNHLPPFKWTPQFNVTHIGLPEEYNFQFITTSPQFPNP